MKFVQRSSLLLAITLTALAGYIDALGFLHVGGYFVKAAVNYRHRQREDISSLRLNTGAFLRSELNLRHY